METGKWGREIRTLGAGVKLLHDKIKTRTSCGVRVGRTVEAVPVEAVVVVGVGAGLEAAVASAGVAGIMFFGAMLLTSVQLEGWLIGVGTAGCWYWSCLVGVLGRRWLGTVGDSIVVDRFFRCSLVMNKRKKKKSK